MRATDTAPMAAATTWPWKKKRGTSPMVSNPKALPVGNWIEIDWRLYEPK